MPLIIVTSNPTLESALRDVLASIGAELLQGYPFAKPENAFRQASIFAAAIA